MERMTQRGFNFDRDFVASNLQSWPIAQALKRLQEIEDAMEDRELRPTYFDRITASPEALAEFLTAVPVIDGPWDTLFQRVFCENCPAQDCEYTGEWEHCPHQEERNSPAWFLAQEIVDDGNDPLW